MASFAFYADSDLITPISSAVGVPEGTNDYSFYIGSTDASIKLQDATNPGVNPLVVSIVDANSGSGPENTWVKLSLSYSGLGSAVWGQSLALGSTILGGVPNAARIWVRIGNVLSGTESSNDLSIKLLNAREFAL